MPSRPHGGPVKHWNLTHSCCYQTTNDLKKLCTNAAATKHGAESIRSSTCVHVHTRRLLRQPAKSNTALSATPTHTVSCGPATNRPMGRILQHTPAGAKPHLAFSSKRLASCWPASHLHKQAESSKLFLQHCQRAANARECHAAHCRGQVVVCHGVGCVPAYLCAAANSPRGLYTRAQLRTQREPQTLFKGSTCTRQCML